MVYVCCTFCTGVLRSQRRTLNSLKQWLQVTVGCLDGLWETNSGPMGKQLGLLTADPSPIHCGFLMVSQVVNTFSYFLFFVII